MPNEVKKGIEKFLVGERARQAELTEEDQLSPIEKGKRAFVRAFEILSEEGLLPDKESSKEDNLWFLAGFRSNTTLTFMQCDMEIAAPPGRGTAKGRA